MSSMPRSSSPRTSTERYWVDSRTVRAHARTFSDGFGFENSEKTQISRRYIQRSTGRSGLGSRFSWSSEPTRGESMKKSARLLPWSVCSAQSSAETMTTASLPWRVTLWGPSVIARSQTIEKRFLASCRFQVISPPVKLAWLARLDRSGTADVFQVLAESRKGRGRDPFRVAVLPGLDSRMWVSSKAIS